MQQLAETSDSGDKTVYYNMQNVQCIRSIINATHRITVLRPVQFYTTAKGRCYSTYMPFKSSATIREDKRSRTTIVGAKVLTMENKEKKALQNETKDETHVGRMQQNNGLRNFLLKVYLTTGAGIAGTLVVSYATAPIVFTVGFFTTAAIGLISSLASIVGLGMTTYEVKEHTISGVSRCYTVQSTGRKLAFAGLVTGMGISLSPLIGLVMAIDSTVVPVAGLATLSTVAGASYYAYSRKDDKIQSWGPALYGSLSGLLLTNIVCFAMQLTNMSRCGHR